MPLITIGLPVYNGEATLERAIDSLLAQSLGDFELLIADDGSSDATPAMCEGYAARDARIRYTRNARNLGQRGNIRQLALQARGRYFLYASQDDIWALTFLERMTEALERPPGAIAAMCAYNNFYPDGEFAFAVRVPPQDWPQRHGFLANAAAVFSKRGRAMRPLKTNNFIHGLIRTDAFVDCLRALPVVFTNERQLVCLLALAGRLVQVDEFLFIKQVARQNLYERQPHDPLVLKRQRASLPHLEYALESVGPILRSRIVPWRRKIYGVPIVAAFLWETAARPAYAGVLGRLKKILPSPLFNTLQRLRGRG